MTQKQHDDMLKEKVRKDATRFDVVEGKVLKIEQAMAQLIREHVRLMEELKQHGLLPDKW